MDTQERDELLIRLDERVGKIREDQKKFAATAEGQEGWGRCQVHSNDITDIKSSITWTRRGLIGAVIAVISKFIYNFFTSPS